MSRMKSNKEKFLSLVSNEETNTLERIRERIANYDSRRIAFALALNILDRLDQVGWSQKQLAEALGVSPQQVNKWVRGKENFTIETLVKIGKALNTSFIEVPHLTSDLRDNQKPSGLSGIKNAEGRVVRYSLKKKLTFGKPGAGQFSIHLETLNMAAEPSVEYSSKGGNARTSAAIDFLLDVVTIHHFQVNEAKKPVETEYEAQISVEYELIEEKRAIACTLKYALITKDHLLVRFEVACVYTIEEADWDNLKNDTKFIIPSSFARHIGAVTSGVARGILQAKIEDSIYKSFPMALINNDDLPYEDIIFEL